MGKLVIMYMQIERIGVHFLIARSCMYMYVYTFISLTRVRRFESGVLVVQSLTHDEASIIIHTEDLVCIYTYDCTCDDLFMS